MSGKPPSKPSFDCMNGIYNAQDNLHMGQGRCEDLA